MCGHWAVWSLRAGPWEKHHLGWAQQLLKMFVAKKLPAKIGVKWWHTAAVPQPLGQGYPQVCNEGRVCASGTNSSESLASTEVLVPPSSRHWWGSDPSVEPPVSIPTPSTSVTFSHWCSSMWPPFTSSSASPSSQSGFSHSFSHLLYIPPPLTHFSSSPSSRLFSFFSYNPVHLDNFHLDCLT